MISRCEYPICIRITETAVKECRKLFGRLSKMELENELTFYIRKNEEAGKALEDKLLLNFDHKRIVSLTRIDEKKWNITGFKTVERVRNCG